METLTETEKMNTIYFEYLDNLRNSGICNMFGASTYLIEHFEIESNEARKILGLWMKNFK